MFKPRIYLLKFSIKTIHILYLIFFLFRVVMKRAIVTLKGQSPLRIYENGSMRRGVKYVNNFEYYTGRTFMMYKHQQIRYQT